MPKKYRTRSEARKERQRLEEQTTCPISLNDFDSSSTIYVHSNIKFDVFYLRNYLLKCPGGVNPVTRDPFRECDIDDINDLCGDGKRALKGEAARRARIQQIEEEANIGYLEDELKQCFTKLEYYWFMRDDQYFNALSNFRNETLEIRMDVLQYRDGESKWIDIVEEFKTFAYQKMIPEHAALDMDMTVLHMRRPLTPHGTSDFEIDTDYSIDDEDSDVDIEVHEPIINFSHAVRYGYGGELNQPVYSTMNPRQLFTEEMEMSS
jgi:hypothetical protein